MELMSSSPLPELSPRLLAVPALVALLSYWGIWNAGFCFDDPMAILSNPLVNGQAGWLDAFTSNFWGDRPGFEHLQSWRPLTVLDLRIDHEVGSGAPWAFHVGNLILVAMLATLMMVVAHRVGLGANTSLMVGVIVAAHPVFSEAVVSNVGKGDLLGALIGLLGLLVAGRRFALGLFVCICALLAKESAVVFALALGVLSLSDRRWGRSLAIGLSIALWYGARAWVLDAGAAVISPLDNPLVELEGGPRVVAAFAIIGRTLSWWLAPQAIAPDYAAGVNLADTSHAAVWLGMGGFAILAALFVRAWRTQDRTLLGALTVAGASLVLLSNLVLLLPTPLAGRLAVPVGLGLTLAAAVGASRLGARWRPLTLGVAAVWLMAGIPATDSMVSAWQSDATLFAHSAELLPDSARGRTNHAKQRIEQGEFADAEAHLRAVLARTPDYPLALQNLSVALARQDRRADAWPVALRAVEVEPRPGRARANLCDLAADREILAADEAALLCREAIKVLPEAPEPRANLARSLARGMRFEEAEAVWTHALERFPRSVFVLGHRVTFLLGRGRLDTGVRVQRSLVEIAPEDPQHRRNLVGLLLQHAGHLARQDRATAACNAAQEAGELAPGVPQVEALVRRICEPESP
jgi:tetratricopeptide (TPR) repeat protein